MKATVLGVIGARTLLGAPGLTTRNKKLLGAPGIATRSKDATNVGPNSENRIYLLPHTLPLRCQPGSATLYIET